MGSGVRAGEDKAGRGAGAAVVERVGDQAHQKVLDRIVAARRPKTARLVKQHRPRLIVLAGATAVSKSTLATQAAAALGISRIVSTDGIREIMRAVRSPTEDPALHRSSFSTGKDGNEIEDWLEASAAVAPGIEATLARGRREGIELVLEGVHIVPGHEQLHAWRREGGLAIGVVMHVADPARHRAMIESREAVSWRAAERYLAAFGRIRSIQNRLLDLAELARWSTFDVALEGVRDPVEYVRRWMDAETGAAELAAQSTRPKEPRLRLADPEGVAEKPRWTPQGVVWGPGLGGRDHE